MVFSLLTLNQGNPFVIEWKFFDFGAYFERKYVIFVWMKNTLKFKEFLNIYPSVSNGESDEIEIWVGFSDNLSTNCRDVVSCK